MKIIDLLDENRYNPLDYERDQQDQMDANKSAFKRREMEHELGHEVNPRQQSYNKPPQSKGMYFYNVPADKENDARIYGLKQTKSGKWYSKVQSAVLDKVYGTGRYWEPKSQESASGGSSSSGSIASAPGRNSGNLIV